MSLTIEENNSTSMDTKSLETQKIKEIIQKVISQVYKKSPTLKEMASMADMSVTKFTTLFNDEYKETPHLHILGKKLIMARELLQTGNYSVSQVSYKVGFIHPSSFTRLFKHKFKYTPSELILNN